MSNYPEFAIAYASFDDLRAGHPAYVVRFHPPRYIASIICRLPWYRIIPRMIDAVADDFTTHGLMRQAVDFYATEISDDAYHAYRSSPEVLIDPHLQLPEWLLCDSGKVEGVNELRVESKNELSDGAFRSLNPQPSTLNHLVPQPSTYIVHTASPMFWCEIIQTPPSKEHPLGDDLVTNVEWLDAEESKIQNPKSKIEEALHFYQTFMPDGKGKGEKEKRRKGETSHPSHSSHPSHHATQAEYYAHHSACPQCGRTAHQQTYVGYPFRPDQPYRDANTCTCVCGWSGIVHSLSPKRVPRKGSEDSK